MSRRSGPLSDIDRATDTFLCCSCRSRCEAWEPTSQDYRCVVFVNTRQLGGEKKNLLPIKSFQASCFFSLHLIGFFFSFHSASVIMKRVQYEEKPERGKCNFILTSVLTQESKSSPIWSITEDSFLFRTAAICSSTETEIHRKGHSEKETVC